MKHFTAPKLLSLAACFALALFVLALQGHAQLSQRWTRDALLEVTATTVAATTDLRGTVTSGWDEVVIHNNDEAIGVGVFVIYTRLSEGFGIDTLAEMQIFVPPVSSRIIRDENVIAVHLITGTSTAALIIERGERR